MSTQQLQLACDSSTLANFKAWAQPISDWFRTVGYTNTADTGQVNWSTIASVPGSAAYVYDIFQSNDSFTQFFIKVEYGNTSGTNTPTVRITLGTGTNGSGSLTGFTTQPQRTTTGAFSPPSTSTQYECDFTGDTANSRIGVMMWRNSPAGQGQELFAIERSLNASGVTTSGYVTIITNGPSTSGVSSAEQQSIVFGVGVPPGLFGTNQTGVSSFAPRLVSVRAPTVTTSGGTSAFNGTIPFDTCAPFVGFWDYPCTMVGIGWGADYAEGVTFTVTLYGSTRTYMPSKNGPFSNPGAGDLSQSILMTAMRYD